MLLFPAISLCIRLFMTISLLSKQFILERKISTPFPKDWYGIKRECDNNSSMI